MARKFLVRVQRISPPSIYAQMDYDQYTTWSENARLARMEYLSGKLTAEEFLRRIDTTHELNSYETNKAELADEIM